MNTGDVVEPPPIEIGPHPHIGLATATWLFRGSVLHSDSLGRDRDDDRFAPAPSRLAQTEAPLPPWIEQDR
jgi:hypothetical protein